MARRSPIDKLVRHYERGRKVIMGAAITIEPTEAMLDAGMNEVWRHDFDRGAGGRAALRSIFVAMITAYQHSPGGETRKPPKA